MLYAAIREWDLKARELYTRRADPPDYDNWRSYADDVLAGRPWAGDCDDLTSTVVDLLNRAGVPKSGLYRVLVNASGARFIDHMIGCVWDDDGRAWIVGDALAGEPYPAEQCRYPVCRYETLDALKTWRSGAPWA